MVNDVNVGQYCEFGMIQTVPISESLKHESELIQAFQSIIFSPSPEQELIKSKIEELRKDLTLEEIDHQLILAFSLDYSKFPLLSPFLSKSTIENRDLIHFDHQLIFLLLQGHFSISENPKIRLEKIIRNCKELICSITLESNLFDFLMIEGKIDRNIPKDSYCYFDRDKNKYFLHIDSQTHYQVQRREKTLIEETIEKDDLEQFRALSNLSDFDINSPIIKNNRLFDYSQVPLLCFCIENKSMKCFKYALINGADPSHMSIKNTRGKWGEISEKEIWDVFGFAGAIGSIQLIKLIEDQGIPINKNLMQGSSKFHQNHIIKWIEKEDEILLKEGIKDCIKDLI